MWLKWPKGPDSSLDEGGVYRCAGEPMTDGIVGGASDGKSGEEIPFFEVARE